MPGAFVKPQLDHTLALTLSYNGAPFCGFARQPGKLTVQGNLEEALCLLFRRDVETTCAGRTDSGVHALGQVVSFDVSDEDLNGRSLFSLRRSLNALTHDGITVREVEPKARVLGSLRRASARVPLPSVRGQHGPHLLKDFLVVRARRVGHVRHGGGRSSFAGEHDFKSFCMAASAVDKPTHRNVREISFHPETFMGENIITIKVVGNAFLHSMVRTIVGTLVTVGRGQRDADWVGEVLAACDRRAAGENAPAQGLVFWRVIY